MALDYRKGLLMGCVKGDIKPLIIDSDGLDKLENMHSQRSSTPIQYLFRSPGDEYSNLIGQS